MPGWSRFEIVHEKRVDLKIHSEKSNQVYSIQRQINEPIFFLEVRHGCANGNFGREFFLVSLKALCSEIYLCLYFNRNYQFARINNKVNFTGTSVVGIVINVQVLDGL